MAKVRVYQDTHQKKRLGARKCPWSVEWRENGRRRSKAIGPRHQAEQFADVKRGEQASRQAASSPGRWDGWSP